MRLCLPFVVCRKTRAAYMTPSLLWCRRWGARKTLEGSEDAKRTVRPVDILDETAMRRDER